MPDVVKRRTSSRPLSRCAFTSAALLVVASCAARPPEALQWLDRVEGEIRHHQDLKRRSPTETAEEYRQRLGRLGVKADLPEEELCALYVETRLDDVEIGELRRLGVVVDPDLWIPPVERKHPLGFHVARVAYSSLPALEAEERIVRVRTLERPVWPANDLANAAVKADLVHAGAAVNGITLPSRLGMGVKIAVLDSGLDLDHPDIPTPVDALDVTDTPWSTAVANHVTDHGTHVVGTVVGKGSASEGQYLGVAPEAGLYFYKIANDDDATASEVDIVAAIEHAQAAGCDVLSMSYGGYSEFMDGSGSMAQAVDAAFAAGMVSIFAAGNHAEARDHTSVMVRPDSSLPAIPPSHRAPTFSYTVNQLDKELSRDPELLQVLWIDDYTFNENIALICTNLRRNEALIEVDSDISERGTEARSYELRSRLGRGETKTYEFAITNTAKPWWSRPQAVRVHCYSFGVGVFEHPDPAYTVGAPALADNAIAAGAVVHRNKWVDYQGDSYEYPSMPLDEPAPFTSRGPRVDGDPKPDLAAPGGLTISCRDSGSFEDFPEAEFIIDDDGQQLNGLGPARYYGAMGTSMACPVVAGVAALVLEQNPSLTPAQLKSILQASATSWGAPDDVVGHGVIDAAKAQFLAYDQ